MALRFSPTGVAVYGTSSVNVDGAVPAALSGRTVGPAAWKSTGVLVYQDGGVGGVGPWVLKQLTLPATIAAIDASPATLIRGGGGQWGAWEPATGLRTSISVGPFAGALLGDVSGDGDLLKIDTLANLSGLTVYDDTGASIFTKPEALLQSSQVCLRDDILSYYDATGWHLIDITTGEPPDWYPRTDGVTWLVPVTHGGNLYVLERSNELTLRLANRADGWVLSSTPTIFSPDAQSVGSLLYCGSCTDASESASSLVVYKLTITHGKNISMQVGTISGGIIVYGAATAVAPATFQVGTKEGSSLSVPVNQPYQVPFVDPKNDYRITVPWKKALQDLQNQTVRAADVLQDFPRPDLTANGYDKVASSGQPTMQASPGATTLTFASADGSVTYALNPATNEVDLSVQGGYCYIPMTTGAIPGEVLFVGGDVMLTKVPVL